MSARAATREDLPELMRLLREFHAETPAYRDMPLNEPKLEAFMGHCIDNPDSCVFVWETAPGVLDGFYSGRVGDYYFTDELAGFDIMFYVRKASRGGPAAKALWQAFHDWAVGKGVRRIWPGISVGIELERSMGFYKGRGLTQMGAVYMLRVGDADG